MLTPPPPLRLLELFGIAETWKASTPDGGSDFHAHMPPPEFAPPPSYATIRLSAPFFTGVARCRAMFEMWPTPIAQTNIHAAAGGA